MLSAAERILIRIALEEGFVSESEMTPAQIKAAGHLAHRHMLSLAGKEPDGRKVYKATDAARKAYESGL